MAWFQSRAGELVIWHGPRKSVAAFEISCPYHVNNVRRVAWAGWNLGEGLRVGLVNSSEEGEGIRGFSPAHVVVSEAARREEILSQVRRFLKEEGGPLPEELKVFLGSVIGGAPGAGEHQA
jgi:hypothetical protein